MRGRGSLVDNEDEDESQLLRSRSLDLTGGAGRQAGRLPLRLSSFVRAAAQKEEGARNGTARPRMAPAAAMSTFAGRNFSIVEHTRALAYHGTTHLDFASSTLRPTKMQIRQSSITLLIDVCALDWSH